MATPTFVYTSTAGASAAVASAAAHRARVEACKAIETSYRPELANLEGKRDYASCIETLYPDPLTPTQASGLKFCIVVILVAAVIGLVKGWRDDGLLMSMACALMYGISAIVGLFVIAVVGVSVKYLFS